MWMRERERESQRHREEFSIERESSRLNMASRLDMAKAICKRREISRGENRETIMRTAGAVHSENTRVIRSMRNYAGVERACELERV